jgi:hypothetical protein
MATCGCCGGDSSPYAGRKAKKPDGPVELMWLCRGCNPSSSYVPIPAPKPRGLAFYRRLTYQIVLPVMGIIFGMIELGIHL